MRPNQLLEVLIQHLDSNISIVNVEELFDIIAAAVIAQPIPQNSHQTRVCRIPWQGHLKRVAPIM